MVVQTQEEMPFFESAEDATYSAILASRKPVKEIAHALWPHLQIDSGYARLKGALSSERPEKLTADEHIFIANHCEQYHFLYYVENQCHHGGTKKVDPAEEKADIERRLQRTMVEFKQLVNRLGLDPKGTA